MERQLFVGRQRELDALLAAIDRREGQLLLVAGDPGTGKSALLTELHRQLTASPEPTRRFALIYRPAETDTVNATLLELMGALLHIEDLTRGTLVWGVTDRDRWRQLLKGIPAVGSLLAQLLQDDRRPVRMRFLETLAAVARALRPAERLVLLFDPEKYLHKDAPAEWLAIAQALPAQVTVIFAQRLDDSLIANTDFATLPTVARVPSRPLGFLTREESEAFLQEWIRHTPELADLGRPTRAAELHALLAEFWTRYEGYPLAMRIVAEELQATPAAPLATLRQLPRRLGDLFQRQYDRVRDGADARGLRLLKALAIQPGPLSPPILSALLELDQDALERVTARREVKPLLRSESPPALALYHALFQEFVQKGLEAAERQAWHQGSLDAYLTAGKKGTADPLALIATEHHLMRSGLLATDPSRYASTALSLGVAFAELPHVNRAENLQRAIGCYQAALRVYTEREFPVDWAMTQNNLGIAYRGLPTGDRGANLQRAIGCYQAALRVYTDREFPVDWAMTQNNLGIAYGDLPTGDRGANLQRAIGCYEAALRVRTEQNFPVDWATTQNNLGIAYRGLPTGDRGANLQRAINCFKAAIRGYEGAGLHEEAKQLREHLNEMNEDTVQA